MTELMKKAIAKIDAEAEKGGYMQKSIAQYIIDNLITDDVSAEKIIDEKKSLEDCMKSVESKARKFAEKGCAMIKDEMVYGWVREYYKVEEKAAPSNIISLDLADLL